MQFSAEKYEKQSSYVIQSTEYNNLLHVHKVRAQSEKLLKGVNIHGPFQTQPHALTALFGSGDLWRRGYRARAAVMSNWLIVE